MNYYLNLFTPETWAAFNNHGCVVSGFRERQKKSAGRIRPGDTFICYLVRLSRWCGVLEVSSEAYFDDAPIFTNPDPYVLRFRVKPLITLDLEQSIPILEEKIWKHLSLTREIEKGAVGWAQHANLRSSLRQLPDADGAFLKDVLTTQSTEKVPYPLTVQDKRRIVEKSIIRAADRSVLVEVPEDLEADPEARPDIRDQESESRESHRMQSAIAQIGAEMGFKIWIPKSDRQRVSSLMSPESRVTLLEILPLNYDDVTLRTIEQIDVIWMKGRSMARAFEIEHTTAVYSGLLRMADLLALQPNMDINLHIVAPTDKREKVLREIRRPVFSLLDRGPLYESCSYLPYDAVTELSKVKHLGHMTDSILEEYSESAEDD